MDFISFEERSRGKEWNMNKLESHPYFELYVLLEGERTIFVKDSILTLKKPSALIIPPFTPHRTEGGPYDRINIYVSPGLLDEETRSYMEKHQAPHIFALNENDRLVLYPLLFSACSFNKDYAKNSLDYKKSFFYTALFFLKKCALIRLDEGAKKLNKSDKQLLNLIAYLNDHWNEKITLDDLCQKFFFSKSNLCKRFKSMLECSISDYLLSVRLNKAKDMLFNTDKKIQRISDECGFSSLNYFSLIFKQKIGISPTAFRKTR